MTKTLETTDGTIAYDDAGSGRLLVLLPGAGDVRSEHRSLAPMLTEAGFRVVTADLRGHGDSSPSWPSYGVAETAGDLIGLIEDLDAGPATVIADSFSPAAALWAAADRPDLIDGVVAISVHLEAGSFFQNLAVTALLRGPLAAGMWAKLYRGWYKASPPSDLDAEMAKLRNMMGSRHRRRAVRETLVARRDGLAERIAGLDIPVLAVFGTADDHFADPAAEAAAVAARTGGRHVMVEGAGHYPHVEQPDVVAAEILAFLGAN